MEIDEILTFWFGSRLDDAKVASEKSALWWSKNPNTDLEIARRFGHLLDHAGTGELSE